MLNIQKIEHYLAIFKQKATRNIKKGCFDDALLYITAAAKTRYDFYLGFQDEDLEKDLQEISSHLVKKTSFEVKTGKRCVFYSKFTRDAHGLTQQYVEALIANGYSFLFLHEESIHFEESKILRSTLEGYKNVECRQVPKRLTRMQKSQWLYDAIYNYGADKLLMQIHPSSAYECVAFYALPKAITRYQINITDHTYWIGTGCTDYTFEFRQYGCYISQEKRGFKSNQQLLLPFYPVMKEIPFEGFPKEVQEKTVFFTGGALYKIIDENFTFFKLCKGILDADSNAIVLFAGSLEDKNSIEYMQEAITRHGLQGRFLLLGHRQDIYEVFRHTDIYINTFPFGGGLMCQYAAHCGIPILNYGSNHIEGCVSQKHDVHFSFSTMDGFIAEALHLSTDKTYRQSKGSELHSAVFTVDDFNFGFEKALFANISPVKIELKGEEENKLDLNGKLNYANKTKSYHYSMTHLFGYRSIFLIPCLFLPIVTKKFTKKLKIQCKK